MTISNNFLEKYGLPTLEYFKANMTEGETEIIYYYQILSATDHIPAKIFEGFIETMVDGNVNMGSMKKFFNDAKSEYEDVLEARKTAREEINKIGSTTE